MKDFKIKVPEYKTTEMEVADNRFIRTASSPDGDLFGIVGDPFIFIFREDNKKYYYSFPTIGVDVVHNKGSGSEYIGRNVYNTGDSEEDFAKFFNIALNLHNIESKKKRSENLTLDFWKTLDDLSEEILSYIEGEGLTKLLLKISILKMHKSLISISNKLIKIGSSEIPGNILDLGGKFTEVNMIMLKDLK